MKILTVAALIAASLLGTGCIKPGKWNTPPAQANKDGKQ